MQRTASELAEYLGGQVEGNPEALVKRFAKIEETGSRNALTFLANMDYEGFIYKTDAEVAIVSSVFFPSQELPKSLTLIRVEEPYDAFARLLVLADQQQQRPAGIHDTASVSDDAEIGDGVAIGPYVVVESGAILGDGADIRSHVVIGRNVIIGARTTAHPFVHVHDRCEIGADCVLHTRASIGADGFGFAPQEDRSYAKVPQTGNVVIGDFCDIGAGTCIDRATLGSTRIGQGAKLDNLIQIAHNVTIGSHTVIAAQTGIAGSTTIGSNCMIGGQVGIGGHLKIADGTRVAAQSGVSASICEPNQVVQGTPAVPIKQFQKQQIFLRRMVREDWDKRISQLESKLNASS